MAIKRTSHAVYDTAYHMVWCPKYRKNIIKGYLRVLVGRLFRKIANDRDWEIMEMEVGADHVHIFISFPPRDSISRVVAILKAKSAGIIFRECEWVKKYYWGKHFWEAGYFVRTVGDKMTKEVIEKYIKRHQDKRDIMGSSDGQLTFFDQ